MPATGPSRVGARRSGTRVAATIEAARHALQAPPATYVLRTTGFVGPALAERVTEWFTDPPTAPSYAVWRAYWTLERETALLFERRASVEFVR